MNKHVQTYIGGIDTDSSKSKYPNNKYYSADRMRPLGIEEDTTSILNNTNGTSFIDDIINGSADLRILGKEINSNFAYLFTHIDTDMDGVQDADEFMALYLLSNDAISLLFRQQLSNDIPHSNSISSTFLNADIVSYRNGTYTDFIFATEGENLGVYSSRIGSSERQNATDFIQDCTTNLTPPTISEIIYGNIPVGKICYTYRVLNTYSGKKTPMSPVSEFVSLVNYSIAPTVSIANIYGGDVGENSYKGIKLSISITDSNRLNASDTLEVYAIHYSVINQEPSIKLVERVNNLNSGNPISIIDSGNYLEELVLEDFRLPEINLFGARHLAVKNNFLFAADIVENYFDIGNYDARVYRFDNTQTARIYKSDGTTLEATINGASPSYPATLTLDAFNISNNYDNTYTYKYKTDGLTLGGNGPNIEYEFVFDDIDTGVISSAYINRQLELDGSYADPTLDMGYERDETYRFGIIFKDKYDRASEVKWIGDIRFPKWNETEPVGSTNRTGIAYTTADGTYYDYAAVYVEDSVPVVHIRRLGIKFTVNTVPTGALSYEIVRVKRGSNRNIIAQGILNRPINSIGATTTPSGGALDYTFLPHAPSYNNTTTNVYDDNLLQFISPEIIYNLNLNLYEGLKLETVSIFHSHSNGLFNSISSVEGSAYGYIESEPTTSYTRNIDEALIVYPTTVEETEAIFFKNSISEDGYEHKVYSYTGSSNYGLGGRSLMIFSSSADFTNVTDIGTSTNDLFLCNIKRNAYNTIYGGVSYTDRLSNVYQSTGYYKSGTGSVDVYGGDIFLNFQDYLYSRVDPEDFLATSNVVRFISFFCESTYNYAYNSTNKLFASYENNPYGYIVQEEAGFYPYTTASATGLVQNEDLYIYNTVYSQEHIENIYLPVSDEDVITEYNQRIKYSDQKFMNEEYNSWLIFRSNNYIDVDFKYGTITNLVNFRDNLYFFQERGFGVLSINEKVLLQAENNLDLILGTGGVLNRYDYVNQNIGLKNKHFMTQSEYYLYWIYEGHLHRYGADGYKNISLNKNVGELMSSYGNLTPSTGRLGFDFEYKELHISNGTNTLVYSERLDEFIYEISGQKPTFYINDNQNNRKLYSNNNQRSAPNDHVNEAINLFKHNTGNKGVYNDESNSIPSSVTLLVNPDNINVKVFNNFEWVTEVLNGTDNLNLTVNSIRIWNDYQDTGTVTLTPGTNIIQRFRTWRYKNPRASIDELGTDISSSNARIRDYYIKVKLTFNNTNNYDIKLHDIITYFMNFNSRP